MGRSHEKTFFQRTHANGYRHMKGWSSLLIIRQIQIKPTMSHHITLVRIAKLTTQETTGDEEDVKKGEYLPLFLGMQTGAGTLGNSVELPQKV